ncbi:MAG: hypothetical protein ACI4WS_08350, partial [Oscillospiraceae bacterium]
NYIALNIRPKSEWNEQEQKSQAVSEAVRNLEPGSEFILQTAEDTRSEVTLPAHGNYSMIMGSFTDDNWLEGTQIGGEIQLPEFDGVKYGTTTISDLRSGVKTFNSPADGYSSDSENFGADTFEKFLVIYTTDPDTGNEARFGSRFSLGLTEDGTYATDDMDDGFNSGDYDNYVVQSVAYAYQAKLGYNDETDKSYALNEAVKNLTPGTDVVLEFKADTRSTTTIAAVEEETLTLTACDGEWLDGCYAFADYDAPAPEGITYNETTIGQLRAAFKSFATTANTYVSDSLNAGADSFEYCIDMNAEKDGDWVRFGNGGFDLTSGGTVSVDDFYSNGTPITTGDFDDYVVTSIIIKVQSKLGWDEEESGKNYALCEDIKNMNPGDTLTLNLGVDNRAELSIPAMDTSVVLYVCPEDEYNDGSYVIGDYPVSAVDGIALGTTTVAQLKENCKTLYAAGKPVYSEDSGSFGKDEFTYAVWMHLQNGDNEEWLCSGQVSFDEIAAMDVDTIDPSYDDFTVADIGFTFRARAVELENGKTQVVNETIRNMSEGEKIYINKTQVFDDEEDKKYEGLGEVKAEGTHTFEEAEWNPGSGEVNTTLIGIDSSWVSSPDDIILIKLTYNKDFFDLYSSSIAITKNEGENETWEDFYVQYSDGDFNIQARVGDLMEKWNCETVEELMAKNLAVQFWVPEIGDTVDYKISVISAEADELDKPVISSATSDSSSVTLIWGAVTDATVYRVYRAATMDGEKTKLKETEATTFTDNSVTAGNTYYYFIEAYNSQTGLSSALSDASSVQVPKAPELEKPDFVLTAGDASIKLEWNEVAGAAKYAVYSYTNGTFKLLATTAETSYTATDLYNGMEYGFLVRAFSGSTFSPYTTDDIKYATPVAAELAKPDFTLTEGDASVKIDWNEVAGATKYAVYSYSNSSFKLLTNTTGTSYTATGLDNGISIGFLVRAYNGTTFSTFTLTDVKYATPKATTLAKPDFTLTEGDASVKISWSEVAGATKYAVYSYSNGSY